jgi:hypothetical protein
MTRHLTRADINLTPEQAHALLVSIGALDKRRVLEGEELEQTLTMLRLLGPGEQTNNQHVWTESWTVGNITYNLHSGENFEELEEVTPYDIQSHKET